MPQTFSPAALGVMVLTLAASVWMFARLAYRWTHARPRAILQDWARNRRFTLRDQSPIGRPEALGAVPAVVDVALSRGATSVVKFHTDDDLAGGSRSWNGVVTTVPGNRMPSGLRPANAVRSVADLFDLAPFPAVMTADRFVVVATDHFDAKALAKLHVAGLLPPDVGLVLHGPYVVVDFSARPFDPVEFDRMLGVLDQISRHLI